MFLSRAGRSSLLHAGTNDRRYFRLAVSIEGICSVSLAKRAIFTLLIFVGRVLVPGWLSPRVHVLVGALRVVAPVSARMWGWFATRPEVLETDMSFAVVKLVFGVNACQMCHFQNFSLLSDI